MHRTARFVSVAFLALAAAGCSDDGLNVQDLNSSSTAGSGGDSTANPTSPQTTADTLDGSASGEGSMTGGTQGDTGASGGTSETPTGTTGDATTTVGTTDDTTDGTGTSEGSSSTGEACQPITEDPSGIGGECINDVDCPVGYTCQPFAGIVFQLSCQILCTQDCECPAGYTCLEIADKSGSTWHQCG